MPSNNTIRTFLFLPLIFLLQSTFSQNPIYDKITDDPAEIIVNLQEEKAKCQELIDDYESGKTFLNNNNNIIYKANREEVYDAIALYIILGEMSINEAIELIEQMKRNSTLCKASLKADIKKFDTEISKLKKSLNENQVSSTPPVAPKEKHKQQSKGAVWVLKGGGPVINPSNAILEGGKANGSFWKIKISPTSFTKTTKWDNTQDYKFEVAFIGEIPVELYAGNVFSLSLSGKFSWRKMEGLIGAALGVETKGIDVELGPDKKWQILLNKHSTTDEVTFNFTVPKNPTDEISLLIWRGSEPPVLKYTWVKEKR